MKISKHFMIASIGIMLFFNSEAKAGVLESIVNSLKGVGINLAKQYGLSLDTFNKTVEQVEKIKEEVAVAKNTYEQAKGQLDTLNEMKKLNQKSYGWGNLLNSTDDLQKLKYTADSWNDTVNHLSKNSEEYQRLLEGYTKQHDEISDDEFRKGASAPTLNRYKRDKQLTASADTQATKTYNDTNQRFQNIHTLTKQIEKADNPKSAADLNSRLVAENANVQTEVLRQLAILNKQSALANEKKLQEEVFHARETAKRNEFNRLPDQ